MARRPGQRNGRSSAGMVIDEQKLALRQRAFGLGFGGKHRNVIVAGVLERGDERSFVFRMIHGEQAGREVLGVGVDRVAEQKQLHHRQRDNESQCYRVAQDLQPLLAQERDESFEGECPSRFLSLHAQHVDEYVFEARLDFVPGQGRRSCQSGWLISSAARSVPAIRRARPNTAAASTPGVRRKCRAAVSRSSPVASKMTSPE